MPADIVQARYEVLEGLARRFAELEQQIDELERRLRGDLEPLEQGGWRGRGAEAFFQEMDHELLPAVRRLYQALGLGSSVMLELIALLQQAEQEAGSVFTAQREPALVGQGVGQFAGAGVMGGAEGQALPQPTPSPRPTLTPSATPTPSPTPSATPTPTAGAQAMLSGPLSYEAQGPVLALQQPNSLACWATVSTMMLSSRDGQIYSINEALDRAGPQYQAMFSNNTGLSANDKDGFLKAFGLKSEPPASYTPEAMASMLRNHGPLWVTTAQNFNGTWGNHGRMVVGIGGDGTPAGTTLRVLDPADGQEHIETYQQFARKYEMTARGDRGGFRPQIVHF